MLVVLDVDVLVRPERLVELVRVVVLDADELLVRPERFVELVRVVVLDVDELLVRPERLVGLVRVVAVVDVVFRAGRVLEVVRLVDVVRTVSNCWLFPLFLPEGLGSVDAGFDITTGLGKSAAVWVGTGKRLFVGLGNGVLDDIFPSPGNKRCHVAVSTTLSAVKPAACLN